MRRLLVIIFAAFWTRALSSILEDKMFIIQKPGDEKNSTLLVVTWIHEDEEEKAIGCEVFSNLELIEEVMKASDVELVRTPSEKDLRAIIDDCTEISRRRRRSSSSFTRRSLTWKSKRLRGFRRDDFGHRNELTDKYQDENTDSTTESHNEKPSIFNVLPVIFPGTKWCGSGDQATKFDELGLHQDTDRCCRAHDLCNDTLTAGETKHNLTNKSSFTKLSCQCDDDFYNCLDRINSVTSNTVGNMYFNLLKRECYAKDYPLTKKCKRYKTFLKVICAEYERDEKAEKVYQWFPAKKYKKIPIPGPLTITLPF